MTIVGETDPAMLGDGPAASPPSDTAAMADVLMRRVAEDPALRQALIAELLGRSLG